MRLRCWYLRRYWDRRGFSRPAWLSIGTLVAGRWLRRAVCVVRAWLRRLGVCVGGDWLGCGVRVTSRWLRRGGGISVISYWCLSQSCHGRFQCRNRLVNLTLRCVGVSVDLHAGGDCCVHWRHAGRGVFVSSLNRILGSLQFSCQGGLVGCLDQCRDCRLQGSCCGIDLCLRCIGICRGCFGCAQCCLSRLT